MKKDNDLFPMSLKGVTDLLQMVTRAAITIEMVYRGCQTEKETIPSAFAQLKEVQEYLKESVHFAKESIANEWTIPEAIAKDWEEEDAEKNSRKR